MCHSFCQGNIKHPLASEQATHNDLLLHNDVRWLIKGKAWDRFCALLDEVKEFLRLSNIRAAADHLALLEDEKFMRKVHA